MTSPSGPSPVILISTFIGDYQNKLDLYVDEYQCKENLEDLTAFLERSNLQKEDLVLRLCQSIINYWNLDGQTDGDGRKCRKELATSLLALFWDLENDEFVVKLIDMMQPLMDAQVEKINSTQQANVCLIISILARKYANAFCDQTQVTSFLAKVIERSRNTTLLLYALMAADKLASSNRLNMNKLINGQNRLDHVIEQFCDRHLIESLRSPFVDYRLQQVAQYARWCLVNVFRPLVSSEGQQTKVTLNANDKTSCLQLSADCLSARSSSGSPQVTGRDLTLELFINLSTNHCYQSAGFQSVRATAPVNSNGLYFYEANLMTDGIMQIGWATKECFFGEGSTDGIGDDQYSIGFDANRRAIWHLADSTQDAEHAIESMPRWKRGDVVGCLIDVPNRNFIFYLNCREFDCQKLGLEIKFSELSYFPAASFSSHVPQQAYFNFGQEQFRYPPRGVLYQDFYDNQLNVPQLS